MELQGWKITDYNKAINKFKSGFAPLTGIRDSGIPKLLIYFINFYIARNSESKNRFLLAGCYL